MLSHMVRVLLSREQPCIQGLSDKGSDSVKFPGREATGGTLGGKELEVLQDQQEDCCGHPAGGEARGLFPGFWVRSLDFSLHGMKSS